jgi:hypothetical protein
VKTNDAGEYRFPNIPWWGKYTVYAEDEDAGYSIFSTGAGRSEPSEVELAPEHREAALSYWRSFGGVCREFCLLATSICRLFSGPHFSSSPQAGNQARPVRRSLFAPLPSTA